MASEVDICNLALSNIRAGAINSLTESSLQAQQCSIKYPILRDMMLREYGWDFATKLTTLAPRFDVDVFNWVYTYQYPSDCLYIEKLILNIEQVGVHDQVLASQIDNGLDLGAQVRYEVMNVDNQKIIVSNEPNLRARYRAKVTNTDLFDPTFTQALSWLLASELAIAIVGGEGGRALRGDAYSIYQNYLTSSSTTHMNERHVGTVESEFITVRN